MGNDWNGLPLYYFYLVPLSVFGPVLVWVMFQIGLGSVVKIPGEMMAKYRREKAEVHEAKRRRGSLSADRGLPFTD